jgi:ABC-type branched-subunit amino acid transport system ATPase component
VGEALELRAVSKRFGGVQAVDALDLSVAPGEAVAVIGPNGAGKSTLLKLIAGIHRPDSGEVHLGEQRLDRLPEHRIVRAGVALAHQVPRPFANLSVRDNVLVGAVSRGRGRQAVGAQVDEVLMTCGLAEKSRVPAGALNVLDLKRLEVARALATEPDVLLLDEVAAGLVGRELELAIDLIRRLHAEGRTLVLVEHVERVVRELVERVVVLDWGRAIAEGTPAEVAADPHVREVYLGHDDATAPPRPQRPAAAAPLLEVSQLDAGYGRMLALRGVDLEVREGEIAAVLGANGAGKTTLAGAISGAIQARGGTVRVLGHDVTGWPAHKRARLGVAHCQEGRRVFSDLTVRQNLELGAPLGLSRSELKQRLAEVQETFPVLEERAGQTAGTLSGGQQQMLAIGRALMARPKLLICDEISLGLAPVVVDTLYETLAAINERGVAVVVVEQNVHRSLQVAHRAYVLSRGRMTFAGDPGELLDATSLDEAYFGHGPRAETAGPAHEPRRET